jgi:cysteine desulfurase/selenocysteine lyase
VVLKWVEVDANGDLDPQAVIDAIGPKTKLVAITTCRTCWAPRST